jgi:hypothetical protein
MSNFGRKAAIASVAFATVGSTVFGGAALAGDKDHKDGKKDVTVTNTGGPGGAGGQSQAQCLIPVGLSLGLLGAGGPVDQCNSTGGAGGAGGAGAVLGG